MLWFWPIIYGSKLLEQVKNKAKNIPDHRFPHDRIDYINLQKMKNSKHIYFHIISTMMTDFPCAVKSVSVDICLEATSLHNQFVFISLAICALFYVTALEFNVNLVNFRNEKRKKAERKVSHHHHWHHSVLPFNINASEMKWKNK